MTINKKVYLIIGLTLTLLTISIISYVAYNFASYGQKKANESAKLMSKAVRDGLTTMMATGSIDKRAYFLDNIAKHAEIANIRVMRSNSVVGQYGTGSMQESVHDSVEKAVLGSGKDYSGIVERDNKIYLRVVTPYIATPNSTPDCLSCHQANKGDVLGAISMEVDLADSIEEGRLVVLKVAALSLFFMIISIAVAGYYIRPYIRLFDELGDGITQAYHGDFSYKIETKLGSEAGAVAQKLNSLSEIFLFKKTIERDKDKNTVYERLIYILKHNFKLQNFWLIEIDAEKSDEVSVYCDSDDRKEKKNKFLSTNECRALRTGQQVVSTDFANLCAHCSLYDEQYLCIPFSLGKRTTLILNIEFEKEEDVRNFGDVMPIVKNYLETAKPVLESKILMDVLEESSLKDPMTGLLNRRFLERFIDNELKDDSEYAVLMIDIDFFKMVNDMYGHDIGDRAIKTLAGSLGRHIKGSDVAVRYGGEEFLVILFDINEESALKIAETIRIDYAGQKIDAGSAIFQKTISIGLALHSINKHDHWQTIKFADEALYIAKESGRNQCVTFRPDMHKGGAESSY
jgi:two-component system, cell cycle response regulator